MIARIAAAIPYFLDSTMKSNQLNRGGLKRMMYVEPKTGILDGAEARIGWVTFSKTGKSIYYRGRTLIHARGIAGNFIDAESGEEFWVSGVKESGSNVHPAGRRVKVVVDEDVFAEYESLRSRASG